MNLFIFDKSAANCAKQLDDKRLNKMLLESCQLLSTALNSWADTKVAPYKSTHSRHPCAIYTAANKYNWSFVFNLALEYHREYVIRFNKGHACGKVLFELLGLFREHLDRSKDLGEVLFDDSKMFVASLADNATIPPNCTNFKQEKDIYKAYKMCLIEKWDNDKIPPKWTTNDFRNIKPIWYSGKT